MINLNTLADYFIISDCHVGTQSSIDYCNYQKLLPFLHDVLNNTKAKLILNGDFFEFLKFPKKKVLKKNQKIVSLLSDLEKEDRLIRIRGNHDENNGIDKYVIDNSILVFHGDTFEKTCHLFSWVTHLISLCVGLTERIFRTDIDRILLKLFKYKRLKKRSKKIQIQMDSFLKKHPEYNAVIIGHSHVPVSNCKYYNSGCFIKNRSDYVEITDKKITLKSY